MYRELSWVDGARPFRLHGVAWIRTFSRVEIGKLELTDMAIVDCTADATIVKAYPDFVRADLHIITPNKRANVLPWKEYEALMELLQKRQKYFFDEANVAAWPSDFVHPA